MRLITDSYLYRVISGEDRGVAAATLRGLFRVGECFYASATRVRNKLYDVGSRKVHRLNVPVISIGNITAGGTGKTPIVRHLAIKLKEQGFAPAILMRGYHRTSGGMSDEQTLLSEQLEGQEIVVHAQGDRVAGGRRVLAENPKVNVFLLDDGFQHRRLARDIDIVLIDATNPFGFGHVHPRGLLRESLAGLGRATAIVLTRCEQVADAQLDSIEQDIHRNAPAISIFRASFIHPSIDSLKTRRIFAAAAIANPAPFEFALKNSSDYRGHWWFADHHDYTAGDLGEIRRRAIAAGADTIMVTEKDWVKLRLLPGASDGSLPILRLEVEVKFELADELRLWDLLGSRLQRP